MKAQVITTGIVLTRIHYAEADRIITFLSPDYGKLRVIAKGVRRPKSKLAGGIELFSVSQLTVLPGRGELGTLISSRLHVHYGNIVKDINKTMMGYEFLKRMNRLTEDAADEDYFNIVKESLSGLNEANLAIELVELWFTMQLLKITGHMPNLKSDEAGKQLDANKKYVFDFDAMCFKKLSKGPIGANHIKLMRLSYGAASPKVLMQVTDAPMSAPVATSLAVNILKLHVRI